MINRDLLYTYIYKYVILIVLKNQKPLQNLLVNLQTKIWSNAPLLFNWKTFLLFHGNTSFLNIFLKLFENRE